MRKIMKLALVLAGALLFTVSAHAQNFITVTATVTDPNGIPYAGGTMNAVLVPGTPGGWTLGGQPYSGRVGPIGLDSTGSFTANFGSNAAILPASSQWQITVNSNPGGILPPLGTGAQSFTVTMTISGPSPQSISSTLNAAAPKLTNFVSAGTVTSFSAGNLSPLFTTSVATPTTTPALSFAQVTENPNVFYGGPASGVAANPTFRALVPADLPATPTVLDCSQQPGADMGAQLNACLAALPAAGGIADATKFSSPQTISTAVTNSIKATITTCGIAISQQANIALSGTGSSWAGCLDSPTVITKAANIDQFTLSGPNAMLSSVTLAGVKASFTGNGVVTATGCVSCKVLLNIIGGEASDDIRDNSGTFSSNLIQGNTLTTWGVHAYESTSTSQQSVLIANYAVGDGTSTGAAILNGGSATLSSNFIKDSNAAILVDDSTSAQGHPVVGNRIEHTNQQTALKMNRNTSATGNQITGGGSSGPSINALLGGTVSSNEVNVVGADGIDVGGNGTVAGNIINMTVTATTGICAVNILGTSYGARALNNSIQFTGTGSGPNYGVCVTGVTGQSTEHNFVEDNTVIGSDLTLSSALYLNNTANIGADQISSNTFQNNTCSAIEFCVSRVDTNNQNYYINNFGANLVTSSFDSGGSTNDVVVENPPRNMAFALLPVAGNGSFMYCTDCTSTTPTTSAGAGAYLTRFANVWSGGAVDSTGKVTGSRFTSATNCSSSASPAVCASAAAGSVALPTGTNPTLQVNTSAVTANSQILLQVDESLGTKLSVTCNTTVSTLLDPVVTARSAGASFTFTIGATIAVNPACISYFIIN